MKYVSTVEVSFGDQRFFLFSLVPIYSQGGQHNTKKWRWFAFKG